MMSDDRRNDPDSASTPGTTGAHNSVVTIRFYGLIREQSQKREIAVQAKTVREALRRANASGVDKELLRDALIFVNGTPLAGSARLNKRLKSGDEIALLSPSGGG